ncbi:NUDIX hydrolase [Marivivens sp. LCG002]|uniref:NUDIX hydrolase n=1 Tax=Marivivens sp. LCG002 TaxID=3051171 RepID=UPI0025527ABE|nr:NUDIX hydrolase [Marivivens sp. LCG002]WIV51126.1 NUDIX hydrolase [Marivivens sp. LCG002]
MLNIPQKPLRLRKSGKTETRTQFAALCYRIKNDKVQVCLITSRGTGRWVLPKGWPMDKKTPAEAAAIEAWEEAGLTGHAHSQCIGVYSYIKPLSKTPVPIVAMVYPVHVQAVHTTWPERHERKRKWFGRKKAASKVAEPALRDLILNFDPKHLIG